MADQTNPHSPTAGSLDGAEHLSHFSNADYDWLGVLDGWHSTDGGHDMHHSPERHAGNNAVAAASNELMSGLSSSANIIAANMAAAVHHESAKSEASPAEAQQPCDMSEMTEHTAPSKSCEATNNTASASDAKQSSTAPPKEAEACAKLVDRVERKRNREKQRRLDTNSQFTTLAVIVREIETTDFVEEAQLNNLYELTQPKTGEEDNLDDGNKKLKSDTTTYPEGSAIQSAIAAAGTYSASNRVELIARTSMMLSQFRAIRKKRNEELRDARRQNCELRKEIEELRRMVAHYKTVGMQKPQDKIMMMVPMMVPQDAVNSVSAGFPAAHLMGGMGGGVFAPQWMPTRTMAMPMNNMNMQFQQQPLQTAASAPFAQLPGNQSVQNPVFQFNQQQVTGQSPGVASLPQNDMMQGQPNQYQVPGMTQTANSTTQESNPPSTGNSTPQQFTQLQVPTQLGMPSFNQGMMQPQQTIMQNPAMNMMFPNPTNNLATPVGMANVTNPSDASVQQQTNTMGTQQPSSDKPSPSAHQGGGGNLAHCA